jgi:hypothetical protein
MDDARGGRPVGANGLPPMTRTRFLLAGLGLAALPVGAAAVGWRYRQPVVPVVPVYYAPVEAVVLSACPPVVPTVIETPTPRPAAPLAPPTVMPGKTVSSDPPAPPTDGVKPAAFSEPAPATEASPAASPTTVRSPELPAATIPKTDLPQTPAADPAKKEPARPAAEPKLDIPAAVPPAARPADAVPPITLPAPPEPKLPEIKLPELPSGASTSRYRPATDTAPGVTLIPVDGRRPADGQFAVGFYNSADRAVELRIDGRSTTLPPRHSLSVRSGERFTYRLNGGAAETVRVPADAAGVEVVIR